MASDLMRRVGAPLSCVVAVCVAACVGRPTDETDAGTADAGDAGISADGAADLGAHDGAARDTGTADLGARDGGAPDLGPFDAGPPDLGCTTDAACAAPVDIAAAGAYTLVRTAGGSLYSWGENDAYQLGRGAGGSGTRLGPARVTTIHGITGMGAGVQSACALVGAQYECWGNAGSGALGDGTTGVRMAADDAHLAGTAATALGEDPAEIAVGALFACARGVGGHVVCWGSAMFGEVGLGFEGPPVTTPARLPGITDAVDLSAGQGHSCVVHADGTVSCWGGNGSSEATGTTSAPPIVPSPTMVPGITDAVEVAAGGRHTCVRRTGGGVMCWGANDQGQLGDGTTTPHAAPAAVTGVTNAVELSAGSDFNCALLADHTVSCWGTNADAELTGASTGSPTPVTAAGATNVVHIAAGRGHVCAIETDGSVICWGDNSLYQCGDDTLFASITHSVPYTVTLPP